MNESSAETRFAFYGRVSTEDNQDPTSSRGWQMTRASALIDPRGGRIVKEFFDVGQSRSLPWQRREQAQLLLAELRNPNRGFGDVVIGEPQRAFYGNQFGMTMPVFAHFQVQLWVPEIGGPIDPDNEAHELVMQVYGGMSKGERSRIKLRVRTAMAAQTELEGRYLGGRPPYGYQVVDLGPHPNPSKASVGRMLRGLVRDPNTAPVVEAIFDYFLRGYGIFAIAELLTGSGFPSPSAYDRARNKHRSGIAWSKQAVRTILTNPRYTGYQVWNKQRTDEVLLDVDDVALGHKSIMRWNPNDKWVFSRKPSHEAIVSREMFDEVHELLKSRARYSTPHQKHRTRHPYVFRGCVYCAACERRMQGQHSNSLVYYRCRFPKEYAIANRVDHPDNVYLREDVVTGPIDAWLASAFSATNLNHTVSALVDAQAPDVAEVGAGQVQRAIAACDAKLGQYRAALEAGSDPVLVTEWITETQTERSRLERQLADAAAPTRRMGIAEVRALVESLGDVGAVLRRASPEDKAQVYREMGLRLTYAPETKTVRADVDLSTHRRDLVRVRRGT
ncbi:recombinase family protein [Actinoplanes sp. L3-i22]|uniref:recombinase family protein n=1 Tax=Actinoplanes sp. L3-i22 TaxID=2836373 RepID=UPI001C773FE4|nr:recombinase family protein [Actinoplanes sp. L3-i22]BCY07345.1 putative recombinase [Actinoplanes sp. L3-i22]